MALPIAMLWVVQECDLAWLVEHFDRLLRLYGKPASNAMQVAGTLTVATQRSAASSVEIVEAMCQVGAPLAVAVEPRRRHLCRASAAGSSLAERAVAAGGVVRYSGCRLPKLQPQSSLRPESGAADPSGARAPRGGSSEISESLLGAGLPRRRPRKGPVIWERQVVSGGDLPSRLNQRGTGGWMSPAKAAATKSAVLSRDRLSDETTMRRARVRALMVGLLSSGHLALPDHRPDVVLPAYRVVHYYSHPG